MKGYCNLGTRCSCASTVPGVMPDGKVCINWVKTKLNLTDVKPFVAADYLDSDEAILAYAREAAKEDDATLTSALNDIVMALVAKRVENIVECAEKYAVDLFREGSEQRSYVAGYCAGAVHYSPPQMTVPVVRDSNYLTATGNDLDYLLGRAWRSGRSDDKMREMYKSFRSAQRSPLK